MWRRIPKIGTNDAFINFYFQSEIQIFRFYRLLILTKSIFIYQNSRTKTTVTSKLSPNQSSCEVPIKDFLYKAKPNLSEQSRFTKTYRDRPIQIAHYCYKSQIHFQIWSGSEAKSPINHMVVMFQLMRVSLNVHPEVLNNKQLFGDWGGFCALDNNLFQLHLRC